MNMPTTLQSPRAARRARVFLLLPLGLALGSLGLTSCTKSPTATAARPTPEAEFITVATQPLTLTTELPGRTSAYRVAEVRARVSGILLKRLFEEGSDVKEGQELFLIDPAPYEAALESAKASLARAAVNVGLTQAQADRVQELLRASALSQQDYDNAIAARDAAVADRAAAEAAVKVATINLGYTHVTSPISGRIGRSAVTEGAYVQQAAATLLATVQQFDPIYVDLTQSSTELLRLRQAIASGRLSSAAGDAAQHVELTLEDGSPYPLAGTLQFSDVTVDPATSSVAIRALFPNPDLTLLPGLFVRARIAEARLGAAILIPQPAVSRNAKGEATALVAGKDDKVEQRVLSTDRTVGPNWLVNEGLQPGDRVIVSNLQRVRPGMVIKPVPAHGSVASGAATAAASPAR